MSHATGRERAGARQAAVEGQQHTALWGGARTPVGATDSTPQQSHNGVRGRRAKGGGDLQAARTTPASLM